jgi:hypothetical protein
MRFGADQVVSRRPFRPPQRAANVTVASSSPSRRARRCACKRPSQARQIGRRIVGSDGAFVVAEVGRDQVTPVGGVVST